MCVQTCDDSGGNGSGDDAVKCELTVGEISAGDRGTRSRRLTVDNTASVAATGRSTYDHDAGERIVIIPCRYQSTNPLR